MGYQFPPELDELVKLQLATGQYGSENEVLLDALLSLQRQRDDLVAIQEGIDDMEAGRVKPLRQFDQELRARKNISPDG